MTSPISGVVEDASGNPIDGATVIVTRLSDDTVVGVATTNSSGEYQVSGLDPNTEYHVAASYDDGSTKYAGESYPFVSPKGETGSIDDFEDGDLAEYTGDTLSFDNQSTVVFEGANALRMNNDDGSPKVIISTSGLDRYPSPPVTFSFRTYFEGDENEGSALFGVQDSNNYYRARLINSAGEIALNKVSGGSSNRLVSKFATLPELEWIEGIVYWNDNGDMWFEVLDDAGNTIGETDVANDTEFTGGGWGWDAFAADTSGDAIFNDIAEITENAYSEPLGSPLGEINTVIDSYEDGSLTEYTGDTGLFNVVTEFAIDGTYSLAPTSGFNSMASFSGLNAYPGDGDTFRYYFYIESGDGSRSEFGALWGATFCNGGTDHDGIEMLMRPNNGDVRMQSRDGGTTSVDFNVDWSNTKDQWCFADVTLDYPNNTSSIKMYRNDESKFGDFSFTEPLNGDCYGAVSFEIDSQSFFMDVAGLTNR